MSESIPDERTVVKTYVPTYQKDEWADHADDLGMSQSEYVRTMVQAGRRGFTTEREEPVRDDTNPRGNGFETRVLEHLDTGTYRSWDELVESLTDGLEDRLDETLQRLQSTNRIRYSGRHGGYTLDGD